MTLIFLTDNAHDWQNIQNIIMDTGLSIAITCQKVDNINHKQLKTQAKNFPNAIFLFFEKQSLTLAKMDNGEWLKVSANWQAMQQRIIKAGKNSELLLKAAKLNHGMHAIDATAGFGYDGLLLASTGASVAMCEKNPLIFLMLITEKQKMNQNKNWQKLMARIQIHFGDGAAFLQNSPSVDLVYLDPMFPKDSYKSAVNKNMQLLHEFIAVPDADDERTLFDTAIKKCNRLIIKRPLSASPLANRSPVQAWQNDVLRFDGYLGAGLKERLGE